MFDCGSVSLPAKQEIFCRALILTGNATEACRQAYPKSRRWGENSINVQACRLSKTPKIILRLAEIKEQVAEKLEITINSLTLELDEAFELAKSCKNPMAMVAATTAKARLHGFLTEQAMNDRLQINLKKEDREWKITILNNKGNLLK